MTFIFAGLPASAKAMLQSVDSEHGNVLKEYAAIGAPLDPTPLQVAQLNRMTALPAPEPLAIRDNRLDIELSPNALVLINVVLQDRIQKD